MGVDEREGSGCAVVISNGDDGDKRMFVGKERAGQVWTDYTGNCPEKITIQSSTQDSKDSSGWES